MKKKIPEKEKHLNQNKTSISIQKDYNLTLYKMFIFLLLSLTYASVESDRQCVLDCAYSQIGKPYVLGTQGPDTFDCSGLVCYCYELCGHGLGYRALTYDLIYEGIAVSEWELTIGDLVLPTIEHVQIYSGNGYIIHAPRPGAYVEEKAMYGMEYGRRLIYDGSSGGGSAPSSGTCTVIVQQLNVRTSPSTSSEIVATYSYNDQIVYDSIVDGEGAKWISYVGGSGNRRYVCGRDSSGSCYVSPCP